MGGLGQIESLASASPGHRARSSSPLCRNRRAPSHCNYYFDWLSRQSGASTRNTYTYVQLRSYLLAKLLVTAAESPTNRSPKNHRKKCIFNDSPISSFTSSKKCNLHSIFCFVLRTNENWMLFNAFHEIRENIVLTLTYWRCNWSHYFFSVLGKIFQQQSAIPPRIVRVAKISRSRKQLNAVIR